MLAGGQDRLAQREEPAGAGARRALAALRFLVDSPWGRAIALAVVLAEVLVWAWPTIPLLVQWQGFDAEVYVLGGRAWLEGAPLYGFTHRDLPFTYPPIAAVVFAPLAALPGFTGARLAIALSAAAYYGSLVVTLRSLWPRGNPWWTALPLFAGSFVLYPVITAIVSGQVDMLLLLLVLADVLLPARRRPRGVLIGLAAALKLTPAVFVLFFLVRREWRAAAVTVASAAAFTGLGFALAWRDSLAYWPSVFQASRVGNQQAALNQSLAGVVHRATALTPAEPATTALWLAACAVAGVVAVVAIRHASAAGRDDLGLAATALLGLLVSPISWAHHWVWAVPTAAMLVRAWLGGGGRTPLVLAALGVPVFLVAPHWVFGTFRAIPGLGVSWDWFAQLGGSAMVWWGVAVLVWVAFGSRASGRAASA